MRKSVSATELLLGSTQPPKLIRPSWISGSVWLPLISLHFLLCVIMSLLSGDEECLSRVLTGKLHPFLGININPVHSFAVL